MLNEIADTATKPQTRLRKSEDQFKSSINTYICTCNRGKVDGGMDRVKKIRYLNVKIKQI